MSRSFYSTDFLVHLLQVLLSRFRFDNLDIRNRNLINKYTSGNFTLLELCIWPTHPYLILNIMMKSKISKIFVKIIQMKWKLATDWIICWNILCRQCRISCLLEKLKIRSLFQSQDSPVTIIYKFSTLLLLYFWRKWTPSFYSNFCHQGKTNDIYQKMFPTYSVLFFSI